MTKSSLRSDRTKTVTTNVIIGFNEATAIDGAIVETGAIIYIVPRKAEAMLQRVFWTYWVEATPPTGTIIYAIVNHEPNQVVVGWSFVELIQRAIVSAVQSWRSVTAIGILDTARTIEVDLKEITLSRRSNLQTDNDYSIVPGYRAGNALTVSMAGNLFVKETLFQDIFKDDFDEWNGYTFEESAS